MQQGARNRHLLAHTSGKLTYGLTAAIPQAQHSQITLNLPWYILHFIKAGEEIEIALCAEAVIQAGRFGQDTDIFSQGGIILADPITGDIRFSTGRSDQSS